jgi:TonB family protein
MRLATLARCLGLLAACGAATAAGKFETVRIDGATHEEGEARWSDSLVREATDRCDDPGIPRPLLPMVSEEQKKKGSPDCIVNTIVVKNASSRPIQCHLSVEAPNSTVESFDMADKVIFPDAMGRFSVFARIVDAPTAFHSTCRILSAQPLAELSVPPGCEVKLRTPNLNDFYPPGAVRRGEEGAVAIEYVVDASGKLKDVAVVSSSGFADLDNATLKYAMRVRATTSCPDQRYRTNVHFRLTDR